MPSLHGKVDLIPGQFNRICIQADQPGVYRGQELFFARPCAFCHALAGTLAQGRSGPDLIHLASRRRIAANMLENNTANLSAWITHAQSLKPAVVTPNITQFTGDELHAIVAYLQQLR